MQGWKDIDNPVFWGETPLQQQTLKVNLVRMPDHSMSEPESLNRAASRLSVPDDAALQNTDAGTESKLADLAALIAAHSGGSLSADLVADMALEVVLNGIVEQACLATGASGAAIVLVRDGEMVCRASSGATAPELGARLDSDSGITGECLRTQRVQRCDDAQADPRADIEASRKLGVRSVIVLPLLRNAELAGVFEVFSTRASAFGERDQRTLEALGQRVIKNLEYAAEPLNFVLEPPPVAHLIAPVIAPASVETSHRSDGPLFGDGAGTTASRGVEVVTWILGLTVVACAILLGALAVERLGWLGETARARPARSTSATGRRARVESPRGSVREDADGHVSASPSSPGSAIERSGGKVTTSSSSVQPASSHKASTQSSIPPAGSLLVYENGREVFRLPPSPERAGSAPGSGVQRASAVEPESAMELSAAAAENGLIHRVEPEYPEEARRRQIQGPVVLDIRINQDGTVQGLKVVSGDSLLAQAATDAVKQWGFKPHAVNGHPVEMQTRITLNFKLPR